MPVGQKIAKLRKGLHLTQGELAERVGVHFRHVSRWETERQRPNSKTLKKVASVLGVTPDDLLIDEPTLPASLVQNPELSERFEQLLRLEPQDRAMVLHMIDTLATHKQLKKLLVASEASSA